MNDKSEMEKLLASSLRDHGLIPEGCHVLVAVSGGVDSVSLLYALISLASQSSWFRVSVAHLDHGLRPTSREDSYFVQQLCCELGVACHVDRVEVRSLACRLGCGIEEAGRDARRTFLQRTAQACGCERIALAHHMDDQAETVLLRMVRGSAVSGLMAMAWQQGKFIRPLLGVSRAAIESYWQSNTLPFVEDSSNAEVEYSRNRIRHQVVPALRQINPEVSLQLFRLTQRVSLEESYWQQQVFAVLDDHAVFCGAELRLACAGVSSLHQALRLRVIRECLRRVRGDLRSIEAVHLELVDGLLSSTRPQLQLDLPRAWVARRYEVLVFRVAAPEIGVPFQLNVAGPGEYSLPEGCALSVSIVEQALGESKSRVEFDADTVTFPLQVRTWRGGDKMSCVGMVGRKKIKDIFADCCTEQEVRARSLVLENKNKVLWLLGVRRSGECCVSDTTSRVLAISISTIDA